MIEHRHMNTKQVSESDSKTI